VRCLLIPAFAALLAAQTSPPAFEVASIKPHRTGGDRSDTNVLPGGRFTGSNMSVRKMIRIALGVEDNLMTGAPAWIDSESYDIDARTAGAAAITPELLQPLILALLEDRFQFRFHRETRELPMLFLEVARNGPKLKPADAAPEPSMSNNLRGTKADLKAVKMSMPGLASFLTRQTGRAVEDRTGIKGEFDVELVWDKDETPDSAGPSLFAALQEQLGLKVNAGKGPVSTLVIDRIERASEN